MAPRPATLKGPGDSCSSAPLRGPVHRSPPPGGRGCSHPRVTAHFEHQRGIPAGTVLFWGHRRASFASQTRGLIKEGGNHSDRGRSTQHPAHLDGLTSQGPDRVSLFKPVKEAGLNHPHSTRSVFNDRIGWSAVRSPL